MKNVLDAKRGGIEINNSCTVMTGDGIALFRLASLKGRLSMELAGMTSRGGSTFAVVKREFGLKGNKQSVYDQFCKIVEAKSATVQRVDNRNVEESHAR